MRAGGARRAAPVLAVALVGLSGGGCGDGVPGAGSIVLTVHYGADVTTAQQMAVTTLTLAVGGAETYEKTSPVRGELTGRTATLRYHPGAASGMLSFTVTLRDASAAAVASGHAGAVIDPASEVTVDVVLHSGVTMTDGGTDMPPPPPDFTTPDLAMPDIAAVDGAVPDLTSFDLSTIEDMARTSDGPAADLAMPDMAVPDMVMPDLVMPDMTLPPDQVVPPDLYSPPDIAGPVMISHTPEKFIVGAGDLVAAVATIDTTNRVLLDKNSGNIPLPPNATFTYDMAARSAVLHVGAWTVGKNNDVKVVGANQLIVLAAGPVTISARINASAVKKTPGAGGVAAGLGSGSGSSGNQGGIEKPGGGGAGFRDPGAQGGNTDNVAGAQGGKAYGGALIDWEGGSGGGNGASFGACDITGGSGGVGGGGGGSIQITSAVGITVDANGSIDVNGGGGQAGCLWTNGGNARTEGGGGGGAGGILFLEAPQVTVSGNLFANGGGGGGAGDLMGNKAGVDGADGALGATPAMGGASSGNGGFGGAGGTDVPPKGSPSNPVGLIGGGGGGGAAGRIILHVRAPAMVGGTLSPMPASFVNL